MENQAQEQIIQQQALKCPRCHSSHTKFCYYNNYSLSQPRYFCKACKRYWTRGGTLRNVPVGGGCRKNKKIKKAAMATAAAIDCSSPSLSAPVITTSTNPSSNQFRTENFNSLFYGLNSNISSSDVNISFQTNNFSVDTTDPVYGYNLQKNLLGFSSKSFLSDYVTTPIFGSSNLGVSPSQTMASLISSYSDHAPEKSISHENNLFGITSNYADMQMQGVNKLNQVEASNDRNSLLSVGTNWFDPSNFFGSSIHSLL